MVMLSYDSILSYTYFLDVQIIDFLFQVYDEFSAYTIDEYDDFMWN